MTTDLDIQTPTLESPPQTLPEGAHKAEAPEVDPLPIKAAKEPSGPLGISIRPKIETRAWLESKAAAEEKSMNAIVCEVLDRYREDGVGIARLEAKIDRLLEHLGQGSPTKRAPTIEEANREALAMITRRERRGY